MRNIRFFKIISVFATVLLCSHLSYGYKIGLGRADCTGPTVEITFMGYVNPQQRGEGLHLRQFSRAFIIQDNNKRIVFVSVESLSIGHDVKREVVNKLQSKYGNLYTIENIMISATHDHSAAGGHLAYLLYDVSVFGFLRQNYDILIAGISLSIERAHDSLQDGRVYMAETEVLNASINRSPLSYLENPLEERQLYMYDTDKTLTQMQFYNNASNLIGVFNWFSVHATSMNKSNHLVSSDNLGYASMLIEKEYNPKDLPGQGKFIGAFACSHSGDVSPNINGPKCEYSRKSCDNLDSKCPIGEGECFASGPGCDMFESTKIIASRIYGRASELLKQGPGEELTGAVNYIHQFIDMENKKITALNPLTNKKENITGCSPALGASFAAGTTDGTGLLFSQGESTKDNKLWNSVAKYLPKTILKEDIDCQAPKPILLPVGRAYVPYPWVPTILPTQLLKIGKFVIIGAPGEFTTMSGRRIRSQLTNIFLNQSNENTKVILAGLTNAYSSYIATPQEYQIQRYEGASTMFGPQTLTLYIDQYEKLARSMILNNNVDQGPSPKNFVDKTLSFQPGVVADGAPIGQYFGYVIDKPQSQYCLNETVNVSFVSGNLRNNLMTEKTFLNVERTEDGITWNVVATDANWETIVRWVRTSTLLGHSMVYISWQVNEDTKPGIYRIKHFGYQKPLIGEPKPYEGTSEPFGIRLC